MPTSSAPIPFPHSGGRDVAHLNWRTSATLVFAIFIAYGTCGVVDYAYRERIEELKRQIGGRIAHAFSPFTLALHALMILVFMCWCHACPTQLDSMFTSVLSLGLGLIFIGLVALYAVVAAVAPKSPRTTTLCTLEPEQAAQPPLFFRSVLDRPPKTRC